jgi:hypothetical protein
VDEAVYVDESVRMLLGRLVGGVRTTSAYYGLGLVYTAVMAAMPSAICCLVSLSSSLTA